MTYDVIPEPLPFSAKSASDAFRTFAMKSFSEMHGLEILGSVPVWVLAGMRLHRVGWRHHQAGWVAGVYEMDLSSIGVLNRDEETFTKDLREG